MSADDEEGSFQDSVSAARSAFREADTAVKHAAGAVTAWIRRRSRIVQGLIAVAIWYFGNWVYTRLVVVFTRLSSVAGEFVIDLAPEFSPIQLIAVVLGYLVGASVYQTRKLNRIEGKTETMYDSPTPRTDGGSQKAESTGGGAIGGAIAGAALGSSYGPGGTLAGAFVGALVGDAIEQKSDRDYQPRDRKERF